MPIAFRRPLKDHPSLRGARALPAASTAYLQPKPYTYRRLQRPFSPILWTFGVVRACVLDTPRERSSQQFSAVFAYIRGSEEQQCFLSNCPAKQHAVLNIKMENGRVSAASSSPKPASDVAEGVKAMQLLNNTSNKKAAEKSSSGKTL
jgi:hypothetical protein